MEKEKPSLVLSSEKQYTTFSFSTNSDTQNGNNYKQLSLPLPTKYSMKMSIITLLVLLPPLLYVFSLHIPPSTLSKDTTFWFLMSNSIIIFIVADTMGVFFVPSSSHDICEKELYEDVVAYSKPSRITSYLTEETTPSIFEKSLVVAEKLIEDKPLLSSCTVEEESERKQLANCYDVVDTKELEKEKEKALVVHNNNNNNNNNSRKKKVRKAKSLDPFLHNGNRRRRSVDELSEKRLRRSVTQCEESQEYEKLSDEELNKRVEEFIKRYYREMRLQLSNESTYI